MMQWVLASFPLAAAACCCRPSWQSGFRPGMVPCYNAPSGRPELPSSSAAPVRNLVRGGPSNAVRSSQSSGHCKPIDGTGQELLFAGASSGLACALRLWAVRQWQCAPEELVE